MQASTRPRPTQLALTIQPDISQAGMRVYVCRDSKVNWGDFETAAAIPSALCAT